MLKGSYVKLKFTYITYMVLKNRDSVKNVTFKNSFVIKIKWSVGNIEYFSRIQKNKK